VEDKIMDIASFAKFMEEHIKVENKTGALGTSVTVAREKAKVSVTTEVDMSKRYMKVRRPGGWPLAGTAAVSLPRLLARLLTPCALPLPVLDKEVPQEAQRARLAAGGGIQQGARHV